MTTDPAAPELADQPVVVADDRAAAAVATRMQLALVLQRGAGIIVLLAVLAGGSIAFGTRFASSHNLLNIALASSFLAIVAVGMTFVIISGGIDLSVGSVLALSAVLTAYASQVGLGRRRGRAAGRVRR